MRRFSKIIEVSDAFFNNEYSEYDEFIQCTMHLKVRRIKTNAECSQSIPIVAACGNKMEKGVPPIIIPLPYNMGPFESPSNKAKVMEILERNGYDFKGFENYLSNGHFNITRM